MAPVYSTDKGRLCPDCGEALADCQCKQTQSWQTDDVIRISRETKGRKGKGVTLVHGLGGSKQELKATAKSIKQACNSGGSVKDGVIEVQGDHRETIKAILEKQGYRVKLAGG